MVNNTTNIERMGFISKYNTNFPQTPPPKTATRKFQDRTLISMD